MLDTEDQTWNHNPGRKYIRDNFRQLLNKYSDEKDNTLASVYQTTTIFDYVLTGTRGSASSVDLDVDLQTPEAIASRSYPRQCPPRTSPSCLKNYAVGPPETKEQFVEARKGIAEQPINSALDPRLHKGLRFHRCFNCGVQGNVNGVGEGVELQCCGGCKLDMYCGRECQKLAWRKGHKSECKKKEMFKVGKEKELVGEEEEMVRDEEVN